MKVKIEKAIKKIYNSDLFNEFFNNEKSSGLVLIGCTIFSLFMANSFFGPQYLQTWHTKFWGESLEYWINDGLMTLFFLLIGLELKREVLEGELSNLKDAMLPIFAGTRWDVDSCRFVFAFKLWH